MIVRLFDPEGMDPKDYKDRYPEIKETPEFKELSGRQLVFIWYYANPTSPIIGILENKERVKEALKISQWRPPQGTKERVLRLQFDERLGEAVERMGKYEPGPRYIAYMGIKKVFEEYKRILAMGEDSFKKVTKNKEGDETSEEIDYAKYVKVTTDIANEYPKLIEKLERGFGISVIQRGGEDEEMEGGNFIREWNLDKQNN